MQISDDIFLGVAIAGGPGMPGANAGPSFMSQGVGPLGRIYIFDLVPAALAVNEVALAQQRVGAGNLVLTAGPSVTLVQVNGQNRYVLDCARNITLTSAGNLSAVNFTVTGWDIYGQRMSQILAGPNANTVGTTKAFKSILSVATSATIGTDASVGTGDVFGLPIAIANVGYIISVKWDAALADDAGTAVDADTSVAGTGTGDVRGTYDPSSASDGGKRLVMAIATPALVAGPNATRNAAFGLNQNLEPSSGGSL